MSAPRPHARRTASKARRRRPLVLALAAAGALTLSRSACSAGASGDAAADGPVTLDCWTYSVKGNDPKAQAIVDRYNELNPDVTVKLSEVGGTADTSSKLLAADRADETPDIVQVEYRALPSLVVAGVVKDITDDVPMRRATSRTTSGTSRPSTTVSTASRTTSAPPCSTTARTSLSSTE